MKYYVLIIKVESHKLTLLKRTIEIYDSSYHIAKYIDEINLFQAASFSVCSTRNSASIWQWATSNSKLLHKFYSNVIWSMPPFSKKFPLCIQFQKCSDYIRQILQGKIIFRRKRSFEFTLQWRRSGNNGVQTVNVDTQRIGHEQSKLVTATSDHT